MSDADQQAIAECDEEIARLAEPADADERIALARAMNRKAIALGRLGRHDEKLAVHREVLERFEDADAPEMPGPLAVALVGTGIALDRLGRHEEAVAAFDAVDDRFSACADPDVRNSVALALRRKGWAFEDLRRTDDAIATFTALAARFADAPEPRIRGWAGQALLRAGWLLGGEGREEEAITCYDELLERFGDDEALPAYDLACGIHNRGLMHLRLGRFEPALADYEALCARFAGSNDRRIAELLVISRADETTALRSLGREAEAAAACDAAVAAYDGVVADFGEPDDFDVREALTRALMNKAGALWRGGRNPALPAVYGDLLARARPAWETWLRGRVVSSLFDYAVLLSNLGRDAEANALPAVAAELLAVPPVTDQPEAQPPGQEIAVLLGEASDSDAWDWFAAPDVDRPRAQLAAGAVALYERTASVIEELTGEGDIDTPIVSAAFLVRSVADGGAILSRSGPIAPHIRALLPVRSRFEAGIRTLGLDRWADDQDHPLVLRASDEDAALELPSPDELPGDLDGFPRAFATAVRAAAVVGVARRSPHAAELLAGANLRERASAAVSRAVNWVNWVAPRRPEAAPAALAMLWLAQGVFCAAWSPAPAETWFPSRDLLRQAMQEEDVVDWFAEAGVILPAWLGET